MITEKNKIEIKDGTLQFFSWHFHYTSSGGWHQLSEAMNFPELIEIVNDKDVPVSFQNVARKIAAGKQVFVILKGER